jgi:hypothetical protein
MNDLGSDGSVSDRYRFLLPSNRRHRCGEYLRMAQEISLVISVGSFGLVVGFLSGYSVRAYLSHQRRRRETLRGSMSITPV